MATARKPAVKKSAIRKTSAPKSALDPSVKIGFLKDEYLFLQKTYEDYDGRAIIIKGWSATIGFAAIGGGFYQSKYLWLFGALLALMFWGIEALWKSFQYMYETRIMLLERAFRMNSFAYLAPFQIYTFWGRKFQKNGFELRRNLNLGIVKFPHLLTFFSGAIFFILDALGFELFYRK